MNHREDLSLAPNTRAAYATQWAQWESWCAVQNVRPLPARTEIVAEYLEELAELRSVNTVKIACAAIRNRHELEGLPRPNVLKVMKAIRRAKVREGAAVKQAPPLRYDDVCQIVEDVEDRCDDLMLRDVAMLLTGYFAGLRVSEVTELRWHDFVRDKSGQRYLNIRFSKTDQEGKGAVTPIQPAAADALEALCASRPGDSANDRIFGLGDGRAAGRRIQKLATQSGFKGVSGHSLRRGCAQDLADKGANSLQLQKALRWKSADMPELYTRNAEAKESVLVQLLPKHLRRRKQDQ